MANRLFKESMENISAETRNRMRLILDYIDMRAEIVDMAYSLYMPQIRKEIEELFDVIVDHSKDKETYNILEIGTKFGGTFYLWNSINKKGLNISVDFSDGGLHGGISEEEMDKRDLWFNERFGNCRFIRGNSHDLKTRVMLWNLVKEHYPLPNDPAAKFDMLFIDGDHSYKGVAQDFEQYSTFVKDGGLIVFHDITNSKRHRDRNVNVAQFWNEIKDDYEHYEFIFPDTVDVDQRWGGIGILIKK